MSLREKPRPIEFMVRGYSVAQMREILARWDALSEDEFGQLGFTAPSQQQSGQQSVGGQKAKSQPLPIPTCQPQQMLRVIQGGRGHTIHDYVTENCDDFPI